MDAGPRHGAFPRRRGRRAHPGDLALMLIFLPRRGRSMLRTAFPGIQLVRGVLLTAGTICIVFAYRTMPITEVQAISFIHPVLLTMLAVVFLGEKVGRLGWTASLLAPFAYVQLLWVSILGMLVFGDVPDAITVVGMAVVVAGGLLVAISREAAGKPVEP
jgi:drug/metabolite transporter (DMT)-like permease